MIEGNNKSSFNKVLNDGLVRCFKNVLCIVETVKKFHSHLSKSAGRYDYY